MSNTSQRSTDLTAKPLTTMSADESSISKIAYLPGGKRVVSCSDDKTRIWDVEKGEQEGTSMVHEQGVEALAITRDGKRILQGGGGMDTRIGVWDVETYECIEEWAGDTCHIYCIALSPDDQLAATGGKHGKIVIRHMKEGGEIKHSIDAGYRVKSLCFSPNGEKLASTGNNKRGTYAIQVYDVGTGELVLGPIKGHESYIHCILWSLDGSWLFSASYDRTIRCWDSDTGESIGEPWTGHTDSIRSLSLSPDGTKLASASEDKTVRFWDARSGDPIEHPLQHDDRLDAVAFSPCGEFVASGGNDQKVSIWRVPWWDESQKLVHNLLLDLPAVPVPKVQHQGEFDFLDLPGGRRPIMSSSRPPARPADHITVPITARVQHFWRGLVARRSSSTAHQANEPRPIQDRRFWKSAARMPVTEVAAGHAKNGVVVARQVPRKRRKKDDKSYKRQKHQTYAGSSAAEAGPSSNAAASTSNDGPSNAQAGPSTSANAAPAGRASSFAQSNTGSDDSWDDMDGCEKCVDYCCFGPRENRERFRPWKKKSRATVEAEKQAKKAKKRTNARRHRTTKPVDLQNTTHPPHHLDLKCDGISTVSPASPAAREAERQRIMLHLQEHKEQLQRQLDDAVAAMERAEAEKDALEKNVDELPYSGDECRAPLEPQRPTGSICADAGPSSTQEGPSGSKSTADSSTPQAGPSSNVPSNQFPSNTAQFYSDSLQAEEQAKEKRKENALSGPVNKAADPQHSLHPRHHHDAQRDDVTIASPASSAAAAAVDLQRAFLQLQEQMEQLRRRVDDPKWKAAAELQRDVEQLQYSGQESHPPQHPHLPTGPTEHSRPSTDPCTPQAGPSTSSNVPPKGHPSASTLFNSDSFQGETHLEKGKEKETTQGLATNKAADLQDTTRPTSHHNSEMVEITADPTTCPAFDEANLHGTDLQWQEQNEQLRRQLGNALAAMRLAEAERSLLEKEVQELRSRSHAFHKQQGPHLSTGSPATEAGPPSSRAEPSEFESTAGPSTSGPSASSNVSPEQPPRTI